MESEDQKFNLHLEFQYIARHIRGVQYYFEVSSLSLQKPIYPISKTKSVKQEKNTKNKQPFF